MKHTKPASGISRPLSDLKFDKPVILVGPADCDLQQLQQLLNENFPVIAADGGANRLLENDIVPNAIIGDMDSLDSELPLANSIEIIRLEEQDSTDFEKCLYSVDAPLFLAFGFSGKRFDHSLASLHTMVKYHRDKNLILISGDDISLMRCGDYEVSLPIGQTISIFPVTPISFSGSSGLKYPLDGLKLEIGAQIGTSNRNVAEDISINPSPECKDTPYLVSLPTLALGQILQLLL